MAIPSLVVVGAVAVAVELGGVCVASNLWHPGHRKGPLLQSLEIDAAEEVVRAHLAVASAPRAEPRGVRLRQQLRDQVPRLPRAVGRRLVPAAHDRVVDVHVRVGAEGRAAAEHLVDQDAETPPVARECVPAVRYNLGREVLGCAAQRVRAVLNHLGKAHVDELEVALRVEEQILGLKVAVRHAARVEVAEGGDDHRRVDGGGLRRELAHAAKPREELATGDDLEEHHHLRPVMEDGGELEDEGVVAKGEDALLVHDVLHLLKAR
mmetsp:Transcript_1469/g.4473  ORF Transcript_1469/g.4473 Transcript_1469/m.4473 type:complete len:265 (-) Transcript_1469:1252-2046(-)